MAQSSSDIISVTVSQVVASLLLPGFGIPLILSPHTAYADRVRYYSGNSAGLTQMVADGIPVTDPAYLAASAIVAQSPAPTKFGIGKLLNVPTQKFVITCTPATGAGQVYKFQFATASGAYQTISYTSVGVDNAQTIGTGLKTAFDALGLAVTTTVSAGGGSVFTLTANVAGAYFKCQILDANGQPTSSGRAQLSLAQTQADPGVAADLAAIQAFDGAWYHVINLFESKSTIQNIAAWVESNAKLYVACSLEDAILGAGSTDIASLLKTAAYKRSTVLYKSENGSFAQAAWAGRVLPLVAGSENWAYKTLAGIPVDQLSEAEITNACGTPTGGTQGKFASVYVSVYGVNCTEFGQTASGSWLDITRGTDALIVDMGARIFTDLSGANKIPYSDKGIAMIERDVRASLAFFQAPPQNFLADSPAPTVTVPLASSLTAGQRASRLLPNVAFTAQLAGALNGTTISGVVIP